MVKNLYNKLMYLSMILFVGLFMVFMTESLSYAQAEEVSDTNESSDEIDNIQKSFK